MNKKIPFPIAIIIIVALAVLVGLISMWGYRIIPGIEIFPLTPPGKTLTEEEWFAKCTDATTIVLFHEQINCYRDFLNDGYSEKSCEKTGEKNKDFCYLGAAIAKRDETICGMSKPLESLCNILLSIIKGGLSEEENIVRCEGFPTCYEYIFAEKGYNGEICEKVKEEEKENCYVGAAAVKKDENLCDKVSGFYTGGGDIVLSKRDLCFLRLAELTKNPQLCSKSGSNYFWCIESVAIAKKDYRVCDLTKEISILGRPDLEKWRCYAKVAEKTKNLNICNLIKYADVKIDCYKYVAFVRNDVEVCHLIKNINGSRGPGMVPLEVLGSNECYDDLAKKLKNETICDYISWENDKEKCKRGVDLHIKSGSRPYEDIYQDL